MVQREKSAPFLQSGGVPTVRLHFDKEFPPRASVREKARLALRPKTPPAHHSFASLRYVGASLPHRFRRTQFRSEFRAEANCPGPHLAPVEPLFWLRQNDRDPSEQSSTRDSLE